MAVRWYLAYPLSSRQVLELLAERGIDVSHRAVLNWVQTFGPQLAADVRRHRRRVGRGVVNLSGTGEPELAQRRESSRMAVSQ
jgi:transposase-like protein